MLTIVASSATISWARAMNTRAIQRRPPSRVPDAVTTASLISGTSFFGVELSIASTVRTGPESAHHAKVEGGVESLLEEARSNAREAFKLRDQAERSGLGHGLGS